MNRTAWSWLFELLQWYLPLGVTFLFILTSELLVGYRLIVAVLVFFLARAVIGWTAMLCFYAWARRIRTAKNRP